MKNWQQDAADNRTKGKRYCPSERKGPPTFDLDLIISIILYAAIYAVLRLDDQNFDDRGVSTLDESKTFYYTLGGL